MGKLGREKKVKDYVRNLIISNQGLINFITGFTKERWSWNLTDKVSQKYWYVNMELMKDFVNLNEIQSRIQNIRFSQNFEHLNSKNRTAIEKFLEKNL